MNPPAFETDGGGRRNPPDGADSAALPLYEPDAGSTYTLEVMTRLTGVASETILRYHEHGLIAPVDSGVSGETCFDADALRTLRRIEHLRRRCEVNVSGLKLVLGLMDEVERLRTELRFRR